MRHSQLRESPYGYCVGSDPLSFTVSTALDGTTVKHPLVELNEDTELMVVHGLEVHGETSYCLGYSKFKKNPPAISIVSQPYS